MSEPQKDLATLSEQAREDLRQKLRSKCRGSNGLQHPAKNRAAQGMNVKLTKAEKKRVKKILPPEYGLWWEKIQEMEKQKTTSAEKKTD